MGSYLSEPVTEKVSKDETDDKLNCGASSMQGWRVSQEDAHNCLLNFDTNTSLFAVYDGHGGHEVAVYCAQKLPHCIKDTESYKNGNFEKALEDAFLTFDASIATPEVISALKKIAGDKKSEEESDEDDNVNNLYEEAAMPIEQVIEKYTANFLSPAVKTLQKEVGRMPVSPFLKARRDGNKIIIEGSSNSSDSNNPSSSENTETSKSVTPESGTSSDDVSSSSGTSLASSDKSSNTSNLEVPHSTNSNTEKETEEKLDSPDSSNEVKQIPTPSEDVENTKAEQNGEVSQSEAKSANVTSSTPQENGEISKKGKGKALAKTKGVVEPVHTSTRPKRNARQLYTTFLDSESESEDDEDVTFEGPNEESSDDDDKLNSTVENENSEDSDSDDDDDDDDDLDEQDEDELEFARNMNEEPGSDSGCTAVVALLKGNDLYVANAGDSRCIVCRDGKAIEMSFDHKPEDEPEHQRVVKAGGRVSMDGRVNGGLNLSRAIGDHAYKQNKGLSDREQMITALPDVRKLTINPAEDEFMILACDGIWNFMSSQEVVEFIRPRIQAGKKLSAICEELFDHCLAPNTLGDGTGCDNMTAIIVQFKSNKKRSASSGDEAENTKRPKTEENQSPA